MNIITIVAITIICTMSIIRVIEHNNKYDIVIVILAVVALFSICKAKDTCTYNSAFDDGYNQAIKDAILWDNDEFTYTISFNGELHEYANYYHED